MPVGAPTLPRGAAHGRRGLPRAQEGAHEAQKLSTGVGDEGGFAPDLREQRGGAGGDPRGHREGRLQAGRGHGARARRGRLASCTSDGDATASTRARRSAKTADGDGRVLPRAGRASTRSARIEDGLAEDDWDGWKKLTAELGADGAAGGRRPVRHQHRAARSAASSEGVANTILIKVNQIGTLTETLEAIELARAAGYRADHQPPLAARPRTPSSPTSPWRPAPGRSRPARASRTDRVAKYNQLLRIEEELGAAARYPGGALWR